MRAFRLPVLALSLLVALALLPPRPAAAERPARVYWLPRAPAPGDPLVVHVEPRGEAVPVGGRLLDHELKFVALGEGRFAALLPVPLPTEPGDHAMTIRLQGPDGAEVEDVRPVTVHQGDFPVSRLRVDPKFTRPSEDVLERIARDREHIDAAFSDGAERPLWREPFRMPRRARTTGSFGTRRTFNGELKSRHRGVDLAGAPGAPVHASAGGRVTLAEDLFYSGNSVFIDHGLGLYTVYFHLRDLEVAPGDRVEAGQRIGTVGSTGRVTGPHLHFGARIDGRYVNPGTLLSLDLAALAEAGGDALVDAEAPAEPAAPTEGSETGGGEAAGGEAAGASGAAP